jgi:2-phosphosulfolactate phosphatase
MGERHCIVAGSIRNAAAVGDWLSREGESVSIIAAGERWEDGTSRFAVEDLLGAGAIIAHLGGQLSPEAASAAAAFDAVRHDLAAVLQRCSSGRELVERGFAGDVALAAELNVEGGVPILIDGAFRRAS